MDNLNGLAYGCGDLHEEHFITQVNATLPSYFVEICQSLTLLLKKALFLRQGFPLYLWKF